MRFFSVPMALLPAPFRARFGAELEEVLESVWAERCSANPLGNLALALRLNFDILSTAVAERFGAGGFPEPKSRQERPLRPLLFDGFRTDVRMALRTTGDPATLADRLRGIVRELNPRAAIAEIAPLQERVNQSLRTPRFYTFLLIFFGGVAALLAAAGVFGVLAFMVSQRSHEIGVRIALGAQRSDVMSLVVRQVALVAALGIAVGLALTIASTRLIGSWLYQVRTTDPLSIAAAAALLLISAGAAAWLPTRRAVRVDPARALRAE